MGMASGNGTPYGLPSIPTGRKVGEHSTGKVGSTLRQLKISLRHRLYRIFCPIKIAVQLADDTISNFA